MIENLYQDITSKIKWFKGLSDSFQLIRVCDRDILSTDLFKIIRVCDRDILSTDLFKIYLRPKVTLHCYCIYLFWVLVCDIINVFDSY